MAAAIRPRSESEWIIETVPLNSPTDTQMTPIDTEILHGRDN
jgi:hypothetical protein